MQILNALGGLSLLETLNNMRPSNQSIGKLTGWLAGLTVIYLLGLSVLVSIILIKFIVLAAKKLFTLLRNELNN